MSVLLTLVPPIERNVGANRALHPDRPWIRVARGGAGLAMLAALAQELFDATQPGNSVDIPQLISQFTFQSNLVLGLVLLVSAARPRVIAALDWLLVTCTVRGPWQRPLLWLCYPVAFLIFSWGRGALDGWYPYDFLDPRLDGGWPAVIATSAQVLAAFLIAGVLVHLAGNARVGLAREAGNEPHA
ncbi:Pr6Pr family membrane protein [Arthrobacter sp. LjRoot78]|uniref:Pr6Pr family membrane protein n=1 Tax=Arthrobacter sp. LjRoot78 TaxID=3342338 RepID=UPI003ECD3997